MDSFQFSCFFLIENCKSTIWVCSWIVLIELQCMPFLILIGEHGVLPISSMSGHKKKRKKKRLLSFPSPRHSIPRHAVLICHFLSCDWLPGSLNAPGRAAARNEFVSEQKAEQYLRIRREKNKPKSRMRNGACMLGWRMSKKKTKTIPSFCSLHSQFAAKEPRAVGRHRPRNACRLSSAPLLNDEGEAFPVVLFRAGERRRRRRNNRTDKRKHGAWVTWLESFLCLHCCQDG